MAESRTAGRAICVSYFFEHVAAFHVCQFLSGVWDVPSHWNGGKSSYLITVLAIWANIWFLYVFKVWRMVHHGVHITTHTKIHTRALCTYTGLFKSIDWYNGKSMSSKSVGPGTDPKCNMLTSSVTLSKLCLPLWAGPRWGYYKGDTWGAEFEETSMILRIS